MQKCVVVLVIALVAAFVCVDVAHHPAAYVRLGTQRLGPGPGEWLVEAPEVHDLRAADLNAAGDRHARELASRDCLVVAKDGVIVHERYHNGADANSLHFVDGAGKTATALLVGALVKSHGLDLDEPLARYGVEAPELAGQLYDVEWAPDAWSKVTTRHLLARVTGAPAASPGADAVPGASFDRSEALQRRVLDRVVPNLVEKLTGVEATRWARERLGEPLGAPDLFERSVRMGEEETQEDVEANKEKGDDAIETKSSSRPPTAATRLAAAGGQMVTCRAAARLGQLVANRGEWLTDRGDVVSLVDGWFVDQMLTPAFPRANAQYGYLGWTHPGAEPALKKGPGKGSGSSGWGGSSISGSASLGQDWSAYTEEDTAVIRRRCDWPGAEAKYAARAVDEERGDGALLGSDGPAYPLAIAQGELGKFILASPHANLVVVSMGNTWGADASCPVDIRPGGAETSSSRETAAEEAFRDAHVDPSSVKIPTDPFAAYAREDDHDLQAAAIRTIVADAARDAAAGLALAPRKPSLGEADDRGGGIMGAAPKAKSDPYAGGVFSGAVDEVATLRALWSVVGAAVTPRPNPWTSGDRRTMWQTMRGGVGAGRAAKRAEKEAEAAAAARKAAAARIAAEEAGAAAAAAASASASASASAGLGRARSNAAAAAAREKRSAARGEARAVSDPPSGNVAPSGKRVGAKIPAKETAVLGKRTSSSSSSPGHHGSCRCSCPPASALGQCVDMRGVDARSCDYDELVAAAAGFCPSMGVLGSSFPPLASSESAGSSESVQTPGKLGGFACLPSADGLASFLCEPVSFGSCAWSDEACGGETEYSATRSASSSLGGVGGRGARGERAGGLVLTTPSRASYVDLRYGSKDDVESQGSSDLGADEAADGSTSAEGRARLDDGGGSNNPRGLIHQTRETIAALAVLGVAALLMTTRVARAYVLDPIFSPVVSPTVLNSVGIDPETPLTPAEKKGARYYGGLD